MPLRLKILTLILALTGLGLGAGIAAEKAENEKIWVGLYLGENNPPPANIIVAGEKLAHSLKEVFGFKHYELVKAEEIELSHNWEQWAVPRKDFFIRIEPVAVPAGQPKLVHFEIYKDGFLVAKGKYEPHKNTPLFINGPDFKQGRLIFVLEAR